MEAMISFVDAYRDDHGVEPICRALEIAPSTYHAHAGRRARPEMAPARVKRDWLLSVEIKKVPDYPQSSATIPPCELPKS
jgi:putative transposase